MSFFTPRSSTFITPGLWANAIASCASASGNARVTSGLGSTFPERSRAIALSKGPHREPTTLISFTTIGHVATGAAPRSEEHTSELQSRLHLVCRLLLEKKKNNPSTRLDTNNPNITSDYTIVVVRGAYLSKS